MARQLTSGATLEVVTTIAGSIPTPIVSPVTVLDAAWLITSVPAPVLVEITVV